MLSKKNSNKIFQRYPGLGHSPARLSITVDVLRFDVSESGIARLEANWAWIDANKTPLVSGAFFKKMQGAATFEASPKLLSGLIQVLAYELIQHMPRQ